MDSDRHSNGASPHVIDEERHLPVLASDAPAQLEQRRFESSLPVPAIATGGFLAGVATLILVRVLRRSVHRPRRGIGLRKSRRGDRALEIAGSRSFLVDVHILKR
jgi:hypothetical protein